MAVRENAEINFERTVVHAPVNGYVTNLVLDVGDYADAGKPVLAVVDQDSFRVEAYLEETKLNSVSVGDLAIVTPLSGAAPIKGEVDSIAEASATRKTRPEAICCKTLMPPLNGYAWLSESRCVSN
jgi:multidrug resistance efflux pump